MRLTATTKQTTGGIGGATTDTGEGSVGGSGVGVGGRNGVSSSGNNGMGSVGEVGVGSVDVGSGAEVGVGGNPRDAIICLVVLSTTATGLTSSRFNVAAPIFPTAGRGHPTLISFVV